ncbi:MAG: DUF4230 domain-containing protein [Bacteroidia bacterium]|nr:DUF4230 domain-containing protein [Bacteroidia bacterium]MCX7652159.1 DUF4230 domain-containing protein [Bacteroidia bacterium]MDW8416892.1 DUF4230 domain-containing protein [Bacteroidia bacterium]
MRAFLRYGIVGIIGVVAGLFLAYYIKRSAPRENAPPPSVEAHAILIQRIAELGQMELLQYQTRDVVRKEWTYVVPFTSSRLLIVVAGEGRVCMDFSAVKVLEADWNSRSVKLGLPPPTLCVVRIDPSQSQVYDADFSVIEWWQGNEADRVREALSAAQETLRVQLIRQLPVESAQRQAETLLRSFCEGMGWKTVSFVPLSRDS